MNAPCDRGPQTALEIAHFRARQPPALKPDFLMQFKPAAQTGRLVARHGDDDGAAAVKIDIKAAGLFQLGAEGLPAPLALQREGDEDLAPRLIFGGGRQHTRRGKAGA